MAYRNITVNGVPYTYIIGRKFTEVKKDGKAHLLVENSKIGNPIHGKTGFHVTPRNVSNAIDGKEIPDWFCVAHKHKSTEVIADPYEEKHKDKIVYIQHCPKCMVEMLKHV